VHHIAGEDCFLVKVRTADAAALMDLMRNTLQKIPNIASTKTTNRVGNRERRTTFSDSEKLSVCRPTQPEQHHQAW